MSLSSTARKDIVEVGRRLWLRGLVAGTDGNISVRLGNNRILITPSGKPKGDLSADELLEVDSDGRLLDGKLPPSSEIAMHLFVYRRRPDIMACVHAHPPYATAFAVAGVEPDPNVLPEVVLFIGRMPLTDYAPPGTNAVPDALQPFIGEHNAFLLRNHGLLTTGRDLQEAYSRHETVEHYCRILHAARQAGPVGTIPDSDFQRLERMRAQREQASGGKKTEN